MTLPEIIAQLRRPALPSDTRARLMAALDALEEIVKRLRESKLFMAEQQHFETAAELSKIEAGITARLAKALEYK